MKFEKFSNKHGGYRGKKTAAVNGTFPFPLLAALRPRKYVWRRASTSSFVDLAKTWSLGRSHAPRFAVVEKSLNYGATRELIRRPPYNDDEVTTESSNYDAGLKRTGCLGSRRRGERLQVGKVNEEIRGRFAPERGGSADLYRVPDVDVDLPVIARAGI